MPLNDHNFIYEFLLIFLITLLLMFGMHYVLVHYAVSKEIEGTWAFFDWNNLFKVNLFVIALCILLVIETLLIVAFYRYTLPSIGISCVSLIIFLSLKSPLENSRIITKIFSPLVSNKYAFLDITDLVLILIINTVMISFLVTVLLKECEGSHIRKNGEEGHPSFSEQTSVNTSEDKK